jgi:uncharacterized Zn finger protein
MEADPLVLFHLRGLPRDRLLARLHDLTPDSTTDDTDEDLEQGIDAALRAARLLELLEKPGEAVEHLF